MPSDPFAFLTPATPNDHIDAMFARLRIAPAQLPVLHRLLDTMLAVPDTVRLRHAGAWEKVAEHVVDMTQRRIRLARSRCTPYFETPERISEAFYCACVLSALPDGGTAGMVRLAQDPAFGVVALQARAAHDDQARLDAEGLPTAQSHAALPAMSKLLVETHAVMLVAQALRAAEARENATAAGRAFAAVARYRPLMGRVDSSMADYFRHLDWLLACGGPARREIGRGGPNVVVTFRPRQSG